MRHACRTLVKQGHQGALEALGYRRPKVTLQSIDLRTPVVTLGGRLEFAISLRSEARRTQPLIIDFVIHHLKANGTTSPKVFKWKNIELAAGAELELSKAHAIKKITTRVYYPGRHRLEIQINGERCGEVGFDLEI